MTIESVVSYSSDYGGTFTAPLNVGASPGSIAGFDVQHTGTVQLGAADGETHIATTFGGAFTNETFGDVAATYPLLITFPWYQWGSNTLKNTGSTPSYLLGSAAAVAGDSLWRVNTGSSMNAITPVANALPVGPNCAMIWKGTRIAVLVNVSGTIKLYTSTNQGNTWTLSGTIANGIYVRGRYFSNTGQQLFIATSTALKYSANFGSVISARTPPVSSGLLGIEVLG